MPLKAGIINAPSSTKNADKARDPEMHQTSRTRKEFTLGIGCENPVVFSSRAVVPLRIHSEHPPAMFEIETLASVEAASGIIIDRRCCFARQRCWGNLRLRLAAKAAFLCHG